MEIFSRLFEIGKLPTKIVAWLALVSGMLIFTAPRIQQKLHTQEFAEKYEIYLGIAFIGSITLIVVGVAVWCIGKVKTAIARRNWREGVLDAFKLLDRHEKIVLREFFIQGRSTILLPFDEPTVAGLLSKGILRSIGNSGRITLAGPIRPMAMYPEIERMLSFADVGLPENPTDADRNNILLQRPSFVHEIERLEEGRRGMPRW